MSLDALSGLRVCVLIYKYINIYVCVYVYAYIRKGGREGGSGETECPCCYFFQFFPLRLSPQS